MLKVITCLLASVAMAACSSSPTYTQPDNPTDPCTETGSTEGGISAPEPC